MITLVSNKQRCFNLGLMHLNTALRWSNSYYTSATERPLIPLTYLLLVWLRIATEFFLRDKNK